MESKMGNKCVEASSSSQDPLTPFQINVIANIILLAAKAIAAIYSSSLSLIASLVDSGLDLLCTLIVWTTNRLVSWRLHSLQRKFPVGFPLNVHLTARH